MEKKYYRIYGEYGVYLFTETEMDKALNRSKEGVPEDSIFASEITYGEVTDVHKLSTVKDQKH